MKHRNFFTTFFLISFLTVNLYGQSSFKDYKDEKTGKRTTYSDGIKKIKENKSLYYSSKEIVLDLYPGYQAGKYYLIMPTYEMPSGKYYKGWSDIYEPADFYENIYLVIKINDGEKVLHLPTQFQPVDKNIISGSGRRDDYEDLKFKIDRETIIHLALARKIEITVSPTKLNRYEEFDYTFYFDDLYGFREFAEGMKLISKD
jgi:hypothetical protein